MKHQVILVLFDDLGKHSLIDKVARRFVVAYDADVAHDGKYESMNLMMMM